MTPTSNFQHYDVKPKGIKTEEIIETLCSTFTFCFH